MKYERIADYITINLAKWDDDSENLLTMRPEDYPTIRLPDYPTIRQCD